MAHAGGDATRSGGQTGIITVLLIGKTGAGKSTLGNVLLGYDPDSKNAPFEASSSVHSKTIYMEDKEGNFCGNRERRIRVIDCPGFADSEGRDGEFDSQLSNMMETVGHVDVLLWCRNGEDDRIDKNEKDQLRACKKIFGLYLFANMVMNLSKWAHSKSAERRREKQGKYFETVKKEILTELTRTCVQGKAAFPIFTLDAMYDTEDEKENTVFDAVAEEMYSWFENLSMRPAFTIKALREYEAKKKAEEAAGKQPEIEPAKEQATKRCFHTEYIKLPWWLRFMDKAMLGMPGLVAEGALKLSGQCE